jgi:hypothetical protein
MKAGAMAIVTLLGIALILPATGGFADWYNLQNANKATADSIFAETLAAVYDMDGTSSSTAGVRLSNSSAPASYFYWYNTSSISPLNKNNVSAFSAGIFNVQNRSTAKNPRWGAAGAVQDTPNNNGWPYWVIYFNYRAWDAYYDNVVRIRLNLTTLHTGSAGSYGDWGKTITLAWSDGTNDFAFWTTTTTYTDNKLKQYIDLDTNGLRQAIIQFGQMSGYLKLTITHQDCMESTSSGIGGAIYVTAPGPLLTTSGTYTYSTASLLGRDDPLSAGAMITAVIGFVGALVVQPNVSLGDLLGRGNKGKGRGR